MATKPEYKEGFDPQIDYVVGAMLTMYVKNNLTNNESYTIDENREIKGMDWQNSAYTCMRDLKPMMDDIAGSKLRGSKFIHLSRFWEDWGKRPLSTVELKSRMSGTENPAMLELRDVVVPKILGFKFYTWYMMENENYGYPYFMDSDFLDLAGGEPSALVTVWNQDRLINTFLTLKEFKENIKGEYTGDFKEFDKLAD